MIEQIKVLDKSKKYALALEGGGFKGSYQAGVIKALYDENIEIIAVAGTSIGALNGSFVASKNIDRMINVWKSFKVSDVFDIEESFIEQLTKFDLSKLSIFEIGSKIFELVSSGGLDISPLKKLIEENSDEVAIRNSDIDFGLVTFSLTDFKPLELMISDIPNGQLNDFLLASAYLPAFKQERLNGKYYIDGGIYNNIPTSLLSSKGYKDIIEIKLKSIGYSILPKEKINKYTIIPNDDLGGILMYDKSRILENIELGYYDALRYINGYKGKNYYIDCSRGDSYYFQIFNGIKSKILLNKVNSKGYKSNNRIVYEILIPKLFEIMKLPKEANYSDLYIGLLEKCLNKLKVNRYRVYQLEELENIIYQEMKIGNRHEIIENAML